MNTSRPWSILSITSLPEFVNDVLRHDFNVVVAEDARDPESLREQSATHQIVLTSVDAPLRAEHIRALAPSVRAIATYSVGLDHIDVAYARSLDLPIFNTPDVLTDSVAEIAMLHILSVLRRASEGIALVRSGTWRGWSPGQLIGREACGRRLAILGMGRIGRAVAQRARAFGMVIHYSNRQRLAAELEAGAIYHGMLEDMLPVADVLLLAAPSGPATSGVLNVDRIARLSRGACVVNVARGDLVDDDALIAGLRTGHVGGAGLDVLRHEPNFDSRYLQLANVFLTPHIGSSTMEARQRMAQILCHGIVAWRRGESAPNRVT